jgi:hypothetical protein
MQAVRVVRLQTVGQIVSAVGTKLDAIRQAQEDDSYIRRALSSNASTAQWPQAGAPQAAARDGFANQSNDTVQVHAVPAKQPHSGSNHTRALPCRCSRGTLFEAGV